MPKGKILWQRAQCVIIIYAVFCRKSGQFYRPVNVKLEQKESRACLVECCVFVIICLHPHLNISFHNGLNAKEKGLQNIFKKSSFLVF